MEIPYLSKTQTHKALDPHRAQRHAHPVSLLSCYLFERGVPARLVTGPQPPGLSPLSNPCLGDSAVPPALKHAPGSPVFKCFLIPLHYHHNFLLPSNADCLKTRLHFLPLPFSSLSPRLAPSGLQPRAPALALAKGTKPSGHCRPSPVCWAASSLPFTLSSLPLRAPNNTSWFQVAVQATHSVADMGDTTMSNSLFFYRVWLFQDAGHLHTPPQPTPKYKFIIWELYKRKPCCFKKVKIFGNKIKSFKIKTDIYIENITDS